MNLLVHMDARGTIFCVSPFGYNSKPILMARWPGRAAQLISTTPLGLATALGPATWRDNLLSNHTCPMERSLMRMLYTIGSKSGPTV